MKSEVEIRESLREWLVAANGRIRPEQLNDQTPLIERRVISSLQLMEFICLLEELSGTPIEVDMLRPGVFKNIDSVYTAFFANAKVTVGG